MKCELGRLKGRGEEERHALAKPRLVAVLRSKLRFTCFLQVPTGSHCLSSSPLPFRLICPTFYYSPPHFSSLSRCTVMLAFLSSSPLPFRLICPTLLFHSPFSLLSRSAVWLTLAFFLPLSFGLLASHSLFHFLSQYRLLVLNRKYIHLKLIIAFLLHFIAF